ncbi:MAG: hypothetical protein ACM32O_07270, partial [Clostridia bacterium]
LSQSAPQQTYLDLTQEEATKLAGFSVKLPGTLPAGDYYLAGFSYATADQRVMYSFHGNAGNPIFVEMWKGDIRKEAAGLTKTAFLKGKAYVGKKAEQYGDLNVFMWEEEEGVIYSMASGLPADKLDMIAQSMGKGNYAAMKKATPVKDFSTTGNLTVKQASERFGYSIKLPSYPSNGKPGNVFHSLSDGEEYVLIMYEIPGKDAFLDIEIKKTGLDEEYEKVPLIEYPLPNAKPVPFENGTAYTFKLKGSSLAKPELTHFNGFMWEEERGIVYKLISDLPHDELMKIASSIK